MWADQSLNSYKSESVKCILDTDLAPVRRQNTEQTFLTMNNLSFQDTGGVMQKSTFSLNWYLTCKVPYIVPSSLKYPWLWTPLVNIGITYAAVVAQW